MKKPRIALVHDFLYTYGGAEQVLSSLHNLYPEAPIYTAFSSKALVAQHYPGATIYASWLQKHPLRRFNPFLLMAMPMAVESFDLREYDIVISSSGAFSHGVITNPHTTHICYCHSPMRYAWDWHAEYLESKGWTGWFSQLVANPIISHLRTWDYISSKRVDCWIANSKTVQARIARFYGASSQVVYPAVRDSLTIEAVQPVSLPEPYRNGYAVTVSRLSTPKRLGVLIEACAQTQTPFIIIGDGAERAELERFALELAAPVQFKGFVSEPEKRDLVGNAQYFLYAAEEDFGIATAEALQLGTPVIGLGIGGTAEQVVPGENGWLVAEPTVAAFAAALTHANQHPLTNRAELAKVVAFSEQRFDQSLQAIIAQY